MIKSEEQFAKFLKSQGKTYISQPRAFRYNGKSYKPDFYCPEDNTYYEVKTGLSSGEAENLIEFKQYYPNITLRVASPNGYPYFGKICAKYLEELERRIQTLKHLDILELDRESLAFLINFNKFKFNSNTLNEIRTLPFVKELCENIIKYKERIRREK